MNASEARFVVRTRGLAEKVLGTYPTEEAAMRAHDGLWFTRARRDGSPYLCNVRAYTWDADEHTPASIDEIVLP